MTERITGWLVSWKCFVACLPGEESQQPTWPHAWHSRSSTQRVPSFRHSSQAPGVRGGGKSAAVRSRRCSHGFVMGFSFKRRSVGSAVHRAHVLVTLPDGRAFGCRLVDPLQVLAREGDPE